MGIDGINAAGQMPGGQTAGGQMAGGMANIKSTDSVSKGIQNEISGIQQQMQELSSKKDIPVDEKMKKRQELQQEMRKLSAELRRRQEQISREQRKESAAAEKKNAGGAEKDTKEDTKKDDEKISAEAAYAGFKAMVSGNMSVDQIKTRGKVVAQIENGIAILKGEISQDELRGMNVDKKRSDLEKQEEKAQKAAASQFSDIGETMRKTAQTSDEKGKTKGRQDAKDRAILKATNYSKEESDKQKQFFVSVSGQESSVS